MLNGEIRSKVDQVWDAFWTGGNDALRIGRHELNECKDVFQDDEGSGFPEHDVREVA